MTFGKGFFTYDGTNYSRPDDGLYLCIPSPWNPERVVWLFAGNSALELYQMTKAYTAGMPQWALWRGDEIKSQGWAPVGRFAVKRLAD